MNATAPESPQVQVRFTVRDGRVASLSIEGGSILFDKNAASGYHKAYE